MIRVSRATTAVHALRLHRLTIPELLCGHLDMARIAKVAGVLVLIAAAKRQWHDVVDYGGKHSPAAIAAPLA